MNHLLIFTDIGSSVNKKQMTVTLGVYRITEINWKTVNFNNCKQEAPLPRRAQRLRRA